MKFRVSFAMAMYENDMCLLSETSNAFIGAFCYSKTHFHPSGPFKSIKTILKSLHILLMWKNIDLTRSFLAFTSLGSNVFEF